MEFGGAFSADAAQIAFSFSNPNVGGAPEQGGVGLLTQSLNFSYQQQITRLYEIGSQRTFYVAGRTQGQAVMARVAGPRTVTMAFYYKFGNVCCAKDNVLQFRAAAMCIPTGSGTTTDEQVQLLAGQQLGQAQLPPNPNASTTVNFKMIGVVITSIGFTVQAENMVINEQVQCMFIALENDEAAIGATYTCGVFQTNGVYGQATVTGGGVGGGGIRPVEILPAPTNEGPELLPGPTVEPIIVQGPGRGDPLGPAPPQPR